MSYCPKCGAEVEAEDAFCRTCGSALRAPDVTSKNQETAGNDGLRPGQLELIGFLIIVAGMFAGFALRPLFALIAVGFVVFLAGRFSR